MSGVMWPPLSMRHRGATLTIRVARKADVPLLERWDRDPMVIRCTTDDPVAQTAFEGAQWNEEIAANSDVSCYYIAELDARPIGAMQVIDPHREPTHYWGDVEPGLRAIDVWIGSDADRNRGCGTLMMRAVVDRCFADPDVVAIVIDPLASNVDAHRFYRRLGFVAVAPRKFGYEDCLVHRLERAAWQAI